MLVIILNDRAGLMGLAVISARSPTGFVRAISNLEPKDRRQIIQSIIAAPDLNIRRKRQDSMAAIRPSGNQDVTDNATDSTAWNENSLALPPNSVQFVEKSLIIIDPAELAPASTRSVGL
jgi:hypothetical protein